MTATCALDNDLVIKLAYYGLLEEARQRLSASGGVGVLGTLKYVARNRIASDQVVEDPDVALAALGQFLDQVERLEPSEAERSLATDLEEVALLNHLDLDNGESQLCAMFVLRALHLLVTGDKRAVRAIDELAAHRQDLAALGASVGCLEQVIAALATTMNLTLLRVAVCAARGADTALALCFSCNSLEVQDDSCHEGLISYIEDLRSQAGHVLLPGVTAW